MKFIIFQEARAFSEAHKWNLDNIEEIACKLSSFEVQNNGHRLVIITQGEKSVILVKSNYCGYIIQYLLVYTSVS